MPGQPWVVEAVFLFLKDSKVMAGMQVGSKESGNQGPEHTSFSLSAPVSFPPFPMA